MKSFTPAETARLIALEAKMDQVLFGQHFDSKTGKMVDDSSITAHRRNCGRHGRWRRLRRLQGCPGPWATRWTRSSKSKRKLGGMGRDFTKMGKFGQIGTAGKAKWARDIGDYIKNDREGAS